MYKLPPDRRKRLSSTDILIAIFLPYINLIVAIFYLTRPEGRERGLHMLAISLIASGLSETPNVKRSMRIVTRR